MSITKASILTAVETALDNATSNTGNLSDAEQAACLQGIQDCSDYHTEILNPNVKPAPSIKFRS